MNDVDKDTETAVFEPVIAALKRAANAFTEMTLDVQMRHQWLWGYINDLIRDFQRGSEGEELEQPTAAEVIREENLEALAKDAADLVPLMAEVRAALAAFKKIPLGVQFRNSYLWERLVNLARIVSEAIQDESFADQGGEKNMSQNNQNAKPPGDQDLEKAEWTTEFINDLPDISFAAIAPGGKKDDSGRTVPRNLRVLPHHGKITEHTQTNVDKPHLKNAAARANQIKVPPATASKARAHLRAHYRALKWEIPENIAKEMLIAALESRETILADLEVLAGEITELVEVFKAQGLDLPGLEAEVEGREGQEDVTKALGYESRADAELAYLLLQWASE